MQEEKARSGNRIVVCEELSSLIHEAAKRVVATAQEAIARRGRFALALAGGSTPKPLYELLATEPWRTQIDWPKTHIFWGDERFVSPDDPRSNYRMTREALLKHVAIPDQNVHRFCTERGNPEEVAAAYEKTVKTVLDGEGNEIPRLDLTLLGLGENGHTASLFPGSPLLHETARLVAADYVGGVGMWRITMTLPLINQSRLVFFLVSGSGKAAVLRDVLTDDSSAQLPAKLVWPVEGALVWLVDRAAMGGG